MGWNEQMFHYCERGLDARFWAEPLNAISNVAFLVAAAAALLAWRRLAVADRRPTELALVVLVGIIGIGSFLFHTFATRWASVADTAPIGIFMLAYLAYALRRFAGAPWLVVGVALAAFVAAMVAMGDIRCSGGACFNGSLAYAPALVALALIGAWLIARGGPAGPLILAGACVFLVSLSLRTIDRSLCPMTAIVGGRALGTHFLWHLCNATLLYLLLRAAILHGRSGARRPAA